MGIRFPVEAGAIAAFARAIGDQDPRWYDEDSPAARQHGGICAPPTFSASVAHYDPDWPYRPNPDIEWHGSGATDGSPAPASRNSDGTSLHAEQHYDFVRPLRAGDILQVRRELGKSWQKESTRAGLMTFEEEITRFDDADGTPVLVSTRVIVVTSRPVRNER